MGGGKRGAMTPGTPVHWMGRWETGEARVSQGTVDRVTCHYDSKYYTTCYCQHAFPDSNF